MGVWGLGPQRVQGRALAFLDVLISTRVGITWLRLQNVKSNTKMLEAVTVTPDRLNSNDLPVKPNDSGMKLLTLSIVAPVITGAPLNLKTRPLNVFWHATCPGNACCRAAIELGLLFGLPRPKEVGPLPAKIGRSGCGREGLLLIVGPLATIQ